MTCVSCTTALQQHNHGDYREGCLGCGIRKLVHMEGQERAAMLDRIQFACGFGARVEAVKLLELEVARIRRLRSLAKGAAA